MHISAEDIVIRGITRSGRPFRPSDWAERLSGVLSTFGEDHRMSYSPYVRPVTLDGVKCVAVNRAFQRVSPKAYQFLLDFARDNDLQVEEGGVHAAPSSDSAAAVS